ncbi:MAG: ATP-binding protein [Candidatus Cryptobacteroides sp.]
MRKFLLTATALIQLATASAQIHYGNIRFKQFGQAEGLPHNTVNTITQDNKGFIWFGTRNGLCRYDGYSLKYFFHDKNDSTSLRHDFIFKLHNDTFNNKIWVSTDNGICAFDTKTERFKQYDIPGNRKNDLSFTSTSTGLLLVCCSNGIFKYDPGMDCFTPFLLHNKNFTRTAIEDGNSNLWIECGNNILRYDLNNSEMLPVPASLKKHIGHKASFKYLGDNKIIFNAKKEILLFDTSDYSITSLSDIIHRDSYICAATDLSGNIWIGTEYGLYVLDGKTYQSIAHYEQSQKDRSQLNDSPIYSLFMDNGNNIWVGTYFGGVNYYIYGSEQFSIYPFGNSRNNLSGKAVRQIIGTGDGGILLTTEDGGINYMDKDRNIVRANAIHKKLGISAKNIHSLKFASDGSLWIGLFLKGVVKYDQATGQTIDYGAISERGSSGFCILETADRKIIYGGPSGIFRINPQGKAKAAEKLSPLSTFCFLETDEKHALVGTRKNGICSIDTQTGDIDTLDVLPVNHIFVTSLFRDSGQDIWVGTNNDGLIVLDKNLRTSRIYTKEDIGSNGIKGIIEDRHKRIWAGTNNGLVCINPEDGKITRYTVDDGLPINQMNYSSAYIGEDGEIFFGTINGLVSFNPETIRQYRQNFNVVITGIWCNSGQLPGSEGDTNLSAPFTDKITLTNPQAKTLRIEYSGMNYKYNDNTRYSIFMEGLDKDWQDVGTQNQIRFSNLHAGNYTLKVKAGNDGTHWDEKGMTTLAIKVLPPWWASVWAFLVYAVLLIALAFVFYRFTKARLLLVMRLRTEQAQKTEMEKMNKQKTDFFTYVSHDLKTPLTLILSPLQKLLSQDELTNADKKKIETVYRNANRMRYLIDELLTFSKIEMNQMKINVRKGDIVNFLGEISLIFDSVAKERGIEFTLDLKDDGREVWFSPSKLERIMYNLLSNAFKYTPAGKDGQVTLSARVESDGMKDIAVISVKDNGRGIPKEMQDKIFESYFQVEQKDHREGFGLGLSLTRSLILMHNGTIRVISEPGTGSEFIVELNVSEKAYNDEEKLVENITDEEIQKYNKRMRDTLRLIPDKLMNDGQEKGRETIMLVEDNTEMNEYLYDILKDKYEVIRASDGKEALQMLSKRLPDIIVTDIMMPGMSGLELTSLVKQDVTTSHIPVIMLTAKTDEKDFTEGYRRGAEAYITKPFNAQNLELLIENIQKNRRRNIERFKDTEEMNVTQIVNNPRDEKFMKELMGFIMDNLSEEDLSVTEITGHLRISRSLLHTKLKSLTGCSITQFIRKVKMKEAKQFLLQGMTVSEVSYAVGISDPNYFTKCFKKEFNIPPTEFIRQCIKTD